MLLTQNRFDHRGNLVLQFCKKNYMYYDHEIVLRTFMSLTNKCRLHQIKIPHLWLDWKLPLHDLDSNQWTKQLIPWQKCQNKNCFSSDIFQIQLSCFKSCVPLLGKTLTVWVVFSCVKKFCEKQFSSTCCLHVANNHFYSSWVLMFSGWHWGVFL